MVILGSGFGVLETIEGMMTGIAFILAAFGVASEPPGQESASSAFEHYETIRRQLSLDQMTDIDTHAEALREHARRLGGDIAAKAVDALKAASDLKTAREQFARVSSALIPAFQKAALKDVHYFTCSMVKQSWAQRGSDVQNPYMGKSMSSCGAPMKPAK
jgi:hypothetical protein